MKDLNNLIAELESYVDAEAGFHKSAMKNDKRMSGGDVSKQDAENNVLGGDRTNLQAAGEKAEAYHTQGGIAQEMTDFNNQDGAPLATEKYKEDANDPYNLEDQRVAQAKKVGEKSMANAAEVNNLESGQKAAYLANRLLQHYSSSQPQAQPQPQQKQANFPQPILPLQEDEKDYMRTLSVEKQAQYVASRNQGIQNFMQSRNEQQHSHPVKYASHNPQARQQREYMTGSKMAENTIMKAALEKYASDEEFQQGVFLADAAFGKLAEKKKVDFNSDEAFSKGASLAEDVIEKMAADLLAVRPIIQDMLAKNILSQEEKEALISYLSSADVLTPQVVDEATSEIENADVVAEAILKALEGPQAANVVPEPAQPVHSPTLSPEQAPVDDIMPGSTEPKETDEEDALIIQAALTVLKKRAAENEDSDDEDSDDEDSEDKPKEKKGMGTKCSKKKPKKGKSKMDDYYSKMDHGSMQPYSMMYQHSN